MGTALSPLDSKSAKLYEASSTRGQFIESGLYSHIVLPGDPDGQSLASHITLGILKWINQQTPDAFRHWGVIAKYSPWNGTWYHWNSRKISNFIEASTQRIPCKPTYGILLFQNPYLYVSICLPVPCESWENSEDDRLSRVPRSSVLYHQSKEAHQWLLRTYLFIPPWRSVPRRY